MSPKFQKRSALKLAGRIIPEAQRNGIMTLAKKKCNEVYPCHLKVAGLFD